MFQCCFHCLTTEVIIRTRFPNILRFSPLINRVRSFNFELIGERIFLRKLDGAHYMSTMVCYIGQEVIEFTFPDLWYGESKMAYDELEQCDTCGKEISKRVESCPHCGDPKGSRKNKLRPCGDIWTFRKTIYNYLILNVALLRLRLNNYRSLP